MSPSQSSRDPSVAASSIRVDCSPLPGRLQILAGFRRAAFGCRRCTAEDLLPRLIRQQEPRGARLLQILKQLLESIHLTNRGFNHSTFFLLSSHRQSRHRRNFSLVFSLLHLLSLFSHSSAWPFFSLLLWDKSWSAVCPFWKRNWKGKEIETENLLFASPVCTVPS